MFWWPTRLGALLVLLVRIVNQRGKGFFPVFCGVLHSFERHLRLSGSKCTNMSVDSGQKILGLAVWATIFFADFFNYMALPGCLAELPANFLAHFLKMPSPLKKPTHKFACTAGKKNRAPKHKANPRTPCPATQHQKICKSDHRRASP